MHPWYSTSWLEEHRDRRKLSKKRRLLGVICIAAGVTGMFVQGGIISR